MKQTDSSHNKPSGTGWQLLGELKLSVDAEADSAISIWLMETLNQLDLQVDLLNKVLKSAQDAAAHILQANTRMAFERLHLLAFAPVNRNAIGKCWGFFRIEKIESVQTDKYSPDHAIEFYLYQEDQ